MYRIRYEHVLSVLGACLEPNYYALIVEYMPLGSLFDVLRKKQPPLTWPDRWSIALQMVKGINYLHMLAPQAILHRDIKSLNFLLKKSDNGFCAKVCDFGLAEIRQETTRQSHTVVSASIGTLQWTAPELLRLGRHTTKSDVYALGIVLWELASGEIPFKGASESIINAFVKAGDRLEIPRDTPVEFAALITQAWAQDPLQRPSCQEMITSIMQVLTTT
jgi:sterile alpha motif and leucine zipper containing kinase AZK